MNGLNENTSLLGDTEQCNEHFNLSKVKSKFKSRRCCLWSSKAALLILTWNLIVSFSLLSFFDPSLYSSVLDSNVIINGFCYGSSSFILFFYPLAGYLADVKWGRHKTVMNSLCLVFWNPIMLVMVLGLAVISSLPMFFYTDFNQHKTEIIISIITLVANCLVFGISVFSGLLLIFCSLIAFSANVIQYGMDQLHDAPTDDSVLYIHRYVWTIFLGSLLIRLPSTGSGFGYGFGYVFSLLFLPLVLLFLELHCFCKGTSAIGS